MSNADSFYNPKPGKSSGVKTHFWVKPMGFYMACGRPVSGKAHSSTDASKTDCDRCLSSVAYARFGKDA